MNTINTFPKLVVFSEALTDLIIAASDNSDTWHSKTGGAGWNVSRAASWLGIKSAFAGAISEDCFGEALYKASDEAGLDLRFLQRVAKNPLLAIVHQTSPVSYFFIGDDSADLYFDPLKLPEGWETHVKWAYFGGISLARAPLNTRLVNIAKTLKKRGVKIIYDPNFRVVMNENYDAILQEMSALADVIKISDEDLCGLFRTKDESAAFLQLQKLNNDPNTLYLVTRGKDGASLICGKNTWHGKPPEIQVIDSVGAGDASAAGLLQSLMNDPKASPETHLRQAISCGSAACLVAGAGLPNAEIILALAAKVKINKND